MKESSQKEQNREEVKVPTDDFRKMHDPGSLTQPLSSEAAEVRAEGARLKAMHDLIDDQKEKVNEETQKEL